MPLNAIPALFGCEACCWKTAYAPGCPGHVWTLRARCGNAWWLSDRQILGGGRVCGLHGVRGR